MKTGNFVWGIILILIGILLLLSTFGIYNINWRLLINLWPLLIIIWGISVLPLHRYMRNLINALIVFAAFSYVIIFSDGTAQTYRWNRTTITTPVEQSFSEPYDAETNTASLNISSGASSITIGNVTENLIDIFTEGDAGNFEFTHEKRNGESIINLKMMRRGETLRRLRNAATINLHDIPLWNIDISSGASDIELNLADYIINNLAIDAGASSIDLRLGSNGTQPTRVVIKSGASSIDIKIPEEVACEIKASTGLSSRNFRNFDQIDSRTYRTNNFDAAEKLIFIDLSTGVSSINISRY